MRTKIRETPDGCWEWIRALNSKGYGSFGYAGKIHLTHRLAYTLLVGPIPEGLHLDHLCHNNSGCTDVPCDHRKCCNPEHLEPVTNRVNSLRGTGLGATNAVKTHCSRNHEFTEENTYTDKRGSRSCRTCRKGSHLRDERSSHAKRAA